MDSITHIALGACMGDAFAGKRLGKRAMLWGALAQSAPDIDFLASIWMNPSANLLGTVVCGGIHMSDIPSFPYELLWGERTVCSVANLTRSDGDHFLGLLARKPVRTTIQAFTLQQANEALEALRQGKIHGAAVLVMPT